LLCSLWMLNSTEKTDHLLYTSNIYPSTFGHCALAFSQTITLKNNAFFKSTLLKCLKWKCLEDTKCLLFHVKLHVLPYMTIQPQGSLMFHSRRPNQSTLFAIHCLEVQQTKTNLISHNCACFLNTVAIMRNFAVKLQLFFGYRIYCASMTLNICENLESNTLISAQCRYSPVQ
jgi:hypothetical protein